jgi:hypothetical protein
MVYRSGRQTAQKQLLDHYQAAGRTRIPIQLLVRCTSTGPSVRGILKSWNSACGTPNGRSRFYLRRKGHSKVPLPGLPWSSGFMEVYERALVAYPVAVVIGASRTMAGTLNAAVVAYYQSAAFKSELVEGSQAGQRSLVQPVQPARKIYPVKCKACDGKGKITDTHVK